MFTRGPEVQFLSAAGQELSLSCISTVGLGWGEMLLPVAVILLVLTGIFLAGIFLAWGLNTLMLISWRRSVGEHWTERARRLYPTRIAAMGNIWLIPAILTLVQQNSFQEVQIPWLVTSLFAWAGVMLGTYPFDREIIPQLASFGIWFRLVLTSWLLQFSIWIVFLVAFISMPERFCWQAILIGCGALVFHIWVNCGLWILLARFFHLLEKPPESLQQVVAKTSMQMGKPYRALWLLNSPVSYAAALPITGDLIFSKRIIELHPETEIAAICAHEIGHLTESRMVKSGRLTGSLMFFPWLFFKPVANEFEFMGIAGLAVVSILLLVFTLRIARRMEVRADTVARDNQAEDGIYARALERLYETNKIPAVMPGNAKAHPHLFDRMLAAGVNPTYERPEPPQRIAFPTFLLSIILGLQLGFMFHRGEDTNTYGQILKSSQYQPDSSFSSQPSLEWTPLSLQPLTNFPHTNPPSR